ncbi:hypothetical protein GO986_20440 [Deinococcus sp. HMF7620]|uniref:ArsR family transcriptional regulator n=1 Tax=Deinococcus arboris TaxID=2682977 RepID=A0A7C9HU57_9DEIO|nr:hypothetical protein [Deinococcus arboris]MVN89113.1 hypothetical protein [Deinococcus arboris]
MKGHFSVQRWTTVTDPQAVETLLNPQLFRYVRPFLGHECTATEAARVIGSRVDTMLYQIGRLTRLGLLEVTATEQHRGRPSRRYRTVAEGFVLPFSAMQAETLLDLFLKRDAETRQAFGARLVAALAGEGGGWHVRLYLSTEDASVNWEAVPDHRPDWRQEDLLAPGAPALWHTNIMVSLTFQEAKALQRELLAVFTRYAVSSQQALASVERQRYALQLGLSPQPVGSEW